MINKSLLCLSVAGLSTASAQIEIKVSDLGVTLENKTNHAFGEYGVRIWGDTSHFTGLIQSLGSGTSDSKIYKTWMNLKSAPLNPHQSLLFLQTTSGANTIDSVELALKTGHSNSFLTPSLTDIPLDTNALKTLLVSNAYYNSAYRYSKGNKLNSRLGAYAGILDSWGNETQLQFAIPQNSWTVNGQKIQFQINQLGETPQFWMAWSAAQELLQMDAQVLLALAMKESNLFVQGSPFIANQVGGCFGPFCIEGATFKDQIVEQFPSLYPASLISERFLGTTRDGLKTVKGEFAINHMIHASLFLRSIHEQLLASSDLGYPQALKVSQGQHALCFTFSIFNTGVNNANVYSHLLPDSNGGTLSTTLQKTSCQALAPTLPQIGSIISFIDSTVQVLGLESQRAVSEQNLPLHDTWITWDDIALFWFGQQKNPSVSHKDQIGGLLIHSQLDTQERRQLWNTLKAGFNLQSSHWPSQSGNKVISLRYDWLSLLRLSKGYLNWNLMPTWNVWRKGIVESYQTKTQSASGYIHEKVAPSILKLKDSVGANGISWSVEVADTLSSQSNTASGIASLEWTADSNWNKWNHTGVIRKSGNLAQIRHSDSTWFASEYAITIPTQELSKIDQSNKRLFWIRITDGAGNSTQRTIPLPQVIQPIKSKTQSLNFDFHDTLRIWNLNGQSIELNPATWQSELNQYPPQTWMIEWKKQGQMRSFLYTNSPNQP
jgi:hypothetical protein